MGQILFKNLELLNVIEGTLKSGLQVLVQDDQIVEVGQGAARSQKSEVIDLDGRTLMPGLIDCHTHILGWAWGLWGPPKNLPSFATAYASDILRRQLMRGFTTVRDTGGADLGHKQAVDHGLFQGPRLFVSGRAISQTGGHGDARAQAELCEPCGCVHLTGGLSRLADGVSEVRRAVRDEIRLGADQIKIMAGGGIASAADPIDQLQYSMEELRAAVDEAERSHTYVAAHVYTAEGIARCIEAGIRTIEHGNMIDERVAGMMARAGAFLVPTLVTHRNIQRNGRQRGFPEEAMRKNEYVLASGTRALEIAQAAGVKMAYGTDLASTPDMQSEEFLVRGEVLSPAEVIRSATVNGAEVVRMQGRLGVVAPGALADLIVVDGDPLQDLGLFQDQGAHIPVIMKNGQFVKNDLINSSGSRKTERLPGNRTVTEAT